MAFRNVGRNKRRSLLAMLSVALSAVLIIVLDGLMGGFLDSMVRNYTKNDVGHVNVETAAYSSRERFMPVNASIPDSGKILAAIRAMPEIRDDIAFVAERIRFGVVLSSDKGTKVAMGMGGDPATEKRLLMLDRSLTKESVYCDEPGSAILGADLARDLGLVVGDKLKVLAQRADYGLGFKKFKIAGLFRSGVSSLDSSFFQIGLGDARDLLGLPAGAGQILVMLNDYRKADATALSIEAGLRGAGIEGMSVASWTSLGDAPRLVKMAESVYFQMYLFVAFLGAFIIANVMMMVTLERRREIGILKSMGMPRLSIQNLFLAEGSLLGAAGSAIGVLAGLGINAIVARKGFDMTSALAGFQFPLDNVIFPRSDPLKTAGIFVLGILVAAALSYLPARKAARMESVEAIRSA